MIVDDYATVASSVLGGLIMFAS